VVIPVGMEYRSKVSDELEKEVSCEQCGITFYYVVTVTGFGHETSPLFLDNAGSKRVSRARAKKNLKNALEEAKHDNHAVPCPNCGWYQKNMYEVFRAGKYSWLSGNIEGLLIALILMSGFVGLMFGGFYLFSDTNPDNGIMILSFVWLVFVMCIVLFAVNHLIFSKLRSRIDPNASDVEERIALGKIGTHTKLNPGSIAPVIPLDTA